MADAFFRNRTIDTRYRIEGEGPVVTFIHGIGSNLDAWDSVLEHFGPGYRILRYDLRGFGQSTRIKGRYEIGAFVEDLMNLLHHLEIERCHLVGFSLGGLIAQAAALMYPDTFDRLVLASTLGAIDEDDQAFLDDRYAQLLRGDPGWEKAIANYFSPEFLAANPGHIEKLKADRAKNDPEIFAMAYRIIAESDFAPYLHQIRSKTLVFTGEHDRASPRMAHAMAAEIPDAEAKVLEGLRHNLLVEDPRLMAATIRDFLDG